MKKLSLLLLAVLLCTVRVEASFEAGEGGKQDQYHSERGENRDTTGKNSDQARTDAARQQGSGAASTTIRDDALAPSAPPVEEDFSNDSGNTATSASAAGAKDAAMEDIFDDTIAARIKEEAQQALAAITRDRDAFRARLAQRHIIPPEELIAVAEALHQSHDVWAQRSDQYSGVLMNAFATRDVPEAEGKNIGALIASCYEVSQAAGNWINEVEAVLLDSTRIEDGRGISKATKRPSGSSDGDLTSPGGSGSDRSRRYSSGSDSSGSDFSVMKGSPESFGNPGRLLDFDLSQLPDIPSLPRAEKVDFHDRNQANHQERTVQPKERAIGYVAGPVPFPIDEDFFSPREAFYSSSLKERQDYMNGFDPVDLRTSHRKSSSLPPGAIVRGPANLTASDSGDITDSEDAHHIPGNAPLDIRAMRRTLDGVTMVSDTSKKKSDNKAGTIAKREDLRLSDMYDSELERKKLRLEADKIIAESNDLEERLAAYERDKRYKGLTGPLIYDSKIQNREFAKMKTMTREELRLEADEIRNKLNAAKERLARAERALKPYKERSLDLYRKLHKTYHSLYSFVSEYGSDYFSGRRAKLEKEFSDLANDKTKLKAEYERSEALRECQRLGKELYNSADEYLERVAERDTRKATRNAAASSGSSRGESVIDYNARRREEEARAARNFVSHGYAYAYTVQGGSLGWSWVYR